MKLILGLLSRVKIMKKYRPRHFLILHMVYPCRYKPASFNFFMRLGVKVEKHRSLPRNAIPFFTIPE